MKKLVRSHIYFGGDYTPGHVPRDGMAEDIRQIKKAADKSAYPEAVRAQCENWEQTLPLWFGDRKNYG